jgi:hypothetical protein
LVSVNGEGWIYRHEGGSWPISSTTRVAQASQRLGIRRNRTPNSQPVEATVLYWYSKTGRSGVRKAWEPHSERSGTHSRNHSNPSSPHFHLHDHRPRPSTSGARRLRTMSTVRVLLSRSVVPCPFRRPPSLLFALQTTMINPTTRDGATLVYPTHSVS